MITREQIRMARAALGWGVRDLAREAGVSANTISRYENGYDALGETLKKMQRALEAGGVTFTNGDEPGVKLRRRE